MNRGLYCQSLRRFTEAKKDFEKIISLAPDTVEYHYHLGTVCQELCQLKEAETNLLKSIELEPNYAPFGSLGKTYQKQGRLIEALQAF